jgi:hypothetical protein
MEQLIEQTFQSFWNFLGVLVLLTGAGKFVIELWSKFCHYLTIRKRGYPPAHCDVEGRFVPFDGDIDEDYK